VLDDVYLEKQSKLGQEKVFFLYYEAGHSLGVGASEYSVFLEEYLTSYPHLDFDVV
jgi:hypothetical protein